MSQKPIRHSDFNNATGRRAYWYSHDGGQTWSLTLGWLEGRAPRDPNYRPTISNLTLEDAAARAQKWLSGKTLAEVRFEGVA